MDSEGSLTTVESPDAPDLCVVVPAFNEEACISALFTELSEALSSQGIRFDVLFVDDGSRDGTSIAIRDLASRHDNVRGVVLSRNFGHQAAVSVGLSFAVGRAVAIMDADLQDQPKDLVELYRAWQSGADVAYAVRRARKEPLALRLSYALFYRMLARISNVSMPIDAGDFCVLDWRFVQRLNDLPERLRYVRGLRAWLGGVQTAVTVERAPRRAGRSHYSLPRLLRLAIEGFVSFSYAPLRVASLAGTLAACASFLGVLVVLGWKITGQLPSGAGVATIALAVLFLGGVQLLSIGILGEYVGRIFDEVKRRPVAVVSEEIGPRRSMR